MKGYSVARVRVTCLKAAVFAITIMSIGGVSAFGTWHSALEAADESFLREIDRKHEIGRMMQGALATAAFGGILTSRNYGRVVTEIVASAGAGVAPSPSWAEAALAVRRVVACAVAKDVQLYVLGYQLEHGVPMPGDRGRYFTALERLWSGRCRR